MNAPARHVLEPGTPQFLTRRQPARFGWWSDRLLVIVKGDDIVTLDADDLRQFRRFVDACSIETEESGHHGRA